MSRAAVRLSAWTAFAVLITLLTGSPLLAASTTLQWDANTEPDLAGYKVHYGTASGTYTSHVDVLNTVTHTVTGLADGATYYFAATAYDSVGNESGYSNEVVVTTATVSNETISTPAAPSGPTSGAAGVAYTYTASGAASSGGDAIQYRFSWADGTDTGWLATGVTSASKTWTAAGTYAVTVDARCAAHTSIFSPASAALSVTIATAAVETVSAPTRPSGPTSGVVGTAYTYTTGGSVSSSGHSVQYRFSWSDGTTSGWLAAGVTSATKTWNAQATYTPITAEARCSQHTSIVSSTSPALSVAILSGAVETVSAPSAPDGPASGAAGVSYSFSTGGAASSTGDSVRYRFHWGDGTVSDWIEGGQTVTAQKSWSVSGTYQVEAEAACATHATVAAFSSAVDVTIADAAPVAYALWSRSDTGQAALWAMDPDTNALQGSAWLLSRSGVGGPWLATAYAPVDASTGYVLWSRSDTGQAALWKVNPATGALISGAFLLSSSGVGAGWQASDYSHVDATTGYVLWTRSETGQAALWKIDPSVAGTIPVAASAYLSSTTGVGRPWRATSYEHVDATTGYVLWTRSDTGQAALWKVNPGVTGTIPVVSSGYLLSASGVGGPWQATGYAHVDAATGYVLWTRSDTGQAAVWKINPGATGTIPVISSGYLYSPSGIGGPWQATGYAR